MTNHSGFYCSKRLWSYW